MSGSGGHSTSTSRQYMNEQQAPYLQNLWAGGQDLMNQQQGQIGPAAQQMSDQLYGQGQNFLGQLGQGQGAYSPSQAANTQIQGLQQGIGQQAERLMAGVGQQGVQAGQFGGGRGEVGKGMVAEGAQQALTQGMGQIYGQDMSNQTAQYGIQQQAAMGGLNSLQGMFGLGMSPYQAQWSPYQQQAGIVGPANIMTKQKGASQNLGGGIGMSGSGG